MYQYDFLEVYGFRIGKYTYWAEKVTLWRRLTDNSNGTIKEMPLIDNSGSFGWRIQNRWINRSRMSSICSKIKLKITLPF